MNNKLKGLLVAGLIVAALPFISNGTNGNKKVTLCHNGHSITISENAVGKHLANHNKSGAKLTCFIVTADKPCTGKKGECPTDVDGCQ